MNISQKYCLHGIQRQARKECVSGRWDWATVLNASKSYLSEKQKQEPDPCRSLDLKSRHRLSIMERQASRTRCRSAPLTLLPDFSRAAKSAL